MGCVCLKDTGEMIGDCGLTLQNIDGEMLPEIGYHIRRDCQCRGIAFYTAFDISHSPAKVFGDSGMRGCDFCGSSGRALYQDRSGHKMTGY